MASLGSICVAPLFGVVSDHSTLDVAGYFITVAALCTVLWTLLMVEGPEAASRELSGGESTSSTASQEALTPGAG